MLKSDFHVHTNASDGILSPTEVVNRAIKNNVSYLAITDHDTINGIEEAIIASKNTSLKIIPGIELSTNHNGESIHILGFFKDDSYKNEDFIKILDSIKNKRVHRAKEIIEKLDEHFNIKISFEKVLSHGKDVIARPHIATEIINSGYNYSFDYIFDNFIGKDKPAYVPTNRLTTLEGIEILHKYNAVVILAHPILIKNSTIHEFIPFKIDGIEAVYFQNTKEQEKSLLAFAKKNNLLISGGSDCHGNFISDFRHGDIGEMSLDSVSLEILLNSLNIK